jgi:hypothetical protein
MLYLEKLGFGQSAFSCKIKGHFPRIDIIITLISQFLAHAEPKTLRILFKILFDFFPPETAMGVSKNTQDKSGYEYAMAVMK